jgi:N-methylhydantoinase B
LCERFGAQTLMDAFAAILNGAAAELRSRIAKLPSGSASAEGFIDNDGVVIGKSIKLAVTINIADGMAEFDFSNSDPQTRGPLNLRPSMIEACVFYTLIGSLGPNLHFNDGMNDCIKLILKEKTITNASAPAAVSNYQQVNLKLVDVLLEAMAHFAPSRAIANAGSSSALGIFWTRGRPGQSSMQYEILGSAYGGGEGHDGASGTACHLSNLHVTPIEILESEYPCRIHQFGFVPDSGGAGQWRGGLSMIREYELLEDATIVRRFDKSKHPPKGLNNGHDGTGAKFTLRPGEPDEYVAPSSGKWELKQGDRFILQTAAGGGYGDPDRRRPEDAERDVAEGYVTTKVTSS